MTTTCTLISDLAKTVPPLDKGIRSRTLFSDDRLKAILVGFAQGRGVESKKHINLPVFG